MNKKILLSIVLFCTLFLSCVKDVEKPTVVTGEVSSITNNSAICGGNVTSDGGGNIMSKGVCWSVNPNPTIEDSRTDCGSGLGVFFSDMTDLKENTTYYVRAYATNETGTNYGNDVSFMTMDLECFSNGHEFVDLGLPSGLKWATCNVGAAKPDGYGEYYAWGELEPKDLYSGSTYLYNKVDLPDFSGDPQYDVARAKWGAAWRMPTRTEYEELMEYCTWEYTTLNNVGGCKVTGQNGNYIFLPGAGTIWDTGVIFEGEGYYLTTTPEKDGWNCYMCSMFFNKDLHHILYYEKTNGNTIRPVTE